MNELKKENLLKCIQGDEGEKNYTLNVWYEIFVENNKHFDLFYNSPSSADAGSSMTAAFSFFSFPLSVAL